MAADRAAAVAAIIDGSAPAPLKLEPAAPPPSSSEPSQHPEAVRARRRRQAARAGQAEQPPKPVARSFTPAARRELPPPPPAPAVASAEDITKATGFLRRLVLGAGIVASKIFRDERMKVPEADADEAATLIIDAWPELAILDADGKKWLAVLYVGSLVGERYGQYQRGVPAPSNRPPAPSNRPPGQPVAVVDAPAGTGSLREVPIMRQP